jgi:hypothetical protein
LILGLDPDPDPDPDPNAKRQTPNAKCQMPNARNLGLDPNTLTHPPKFSTLKFFFENRLTFCCFSD